MPVCRARVVPRARMRALVVRHGALGNPGTKRLGFGIVEQLGMIRSRQYCDDRRRFVRRQRRRLPLGIGDAANRLEVIFDARACLRELWAVAVDAVLLENRIFDVSEDEWRLG